MHCACAVASMDTGASASARQTRKQIDAKRYAAEMEADCIPVLKYGIGFSGKRVSLV